MPNKNLHLSRTTCARLGQLRNASAYVEQLVANGWPRAEEAVRMLQRAGWSSDDIHDYSRNVIPCGIVGIEEAIRIVALELAAGNSHIEELIRGDD